MNTPSAFFDAVARWVTLTPEQQHRLAAVFRARSVEARTPVALPGSTDHAVLFVVEGMLRFYYTTDEGRESNKAFVGAGEFAGALAAANLGLPLLYGIEALEPTTLLAAPYADFAALMEADPAFERLGRKLAERILARKELRTRSLLLRSGTERYLDLLDARPDLVQRVPLYHLASYLGITDVHLSRIRRDLAEPTVPVGASSRAEED